MSYRSLMFQSKRTLGLCLISLILATLPTAWATNDGNVFGSPPPSYIPGSSSEFAYTSTSDTPLTVNFDDFIYESSIITSSSSNGGPGGKGGNKLGNAPEALYRVLEKFLARGRMPPPQFPVPYVVYTLSDGVEKFTNVLTKMPIMINVDDDSGTGQGGRDIRVKTTIDVSPLRITALVERLGSSNPSYLEVLVTFPAFFYTGESGAPGGNPYWQFGYETQPDCEIPSDITMTFSVDASIGSDHIFDFDWSSDSGIPELGFIFGTFQVLDHDITAPQLPAFSNFIVSSPPSAFLTFETTETDTLTRKCMTWNAPSAFFLQFNYGEIEEIGGMTVEYNIAATIDQVPQTFSICTTEDRAAGTYSVDYVASSTVNLLQLLTEIIIGSTANITINLEIQDMPAEIHVILSDGSLAVDVSENVGLLQLEATADLGLAGIASLINVKLVLADIPDFTATWYFVGFTFDAPSCLGRIEFAFSDGPLTYPTIHDTELNSNYLFAHSVPGLTALALRLHKVRHVSFDQNNANASNSLNIQVCERRVTYIIAHTETASLLTPNHNTDLTITLNTTPTDMSITWTVPFTLSIQTNDVITSIIGDLSLQNLAGTLDLTAHAEITNIPANMAWTINPGGSIAFTADASIGSLTLTASDPNGLLNAGALFAGDPARRLHIIIQDIPSFTATWVAEAATPRTAVTFNTAPGTGIGSLTFSLSTSETSAVSISAPGIENRAILYNDDTHDLGNGLVMEGSLWVHVEDTSLVELEWMGGTPTIHVAFGATQPNELIATAVLDGTSSLNPAAPDHLTATVETTSLPTSTDFTVTPTSFTHTASSEIAVVTLDITIGESPDPDVTQIYGEVGGIPTSVTVSWDTGLFSATLSDRLDYVLVTINNPTGIFGTELQYVEIEVLDIPATVTASWNIANQVATLSFLGGTFSEGLGDFRFLATTGEEAPTTTYINSLGVVLPSMTDYGDFTRDIDSGYWPATVPSRFNSLHTRHPTLDTSADDYFLYRTGTDFDVYAGRLREIGSINVDLKNPGFADLQFSPNVVLARQLYLMMDDVESDWMTIAEASELPHGQATNSLHAEWNTAGRHYGYTLSQVIPFIDIYDGQHDSTSLTSEYMKLLFQDVPASVTIDYEFGDRDGYFDFVASSAWQMGYLSQGGGNRYVGWLLLQSVHFDYSFALPGEEPADIGDYDLEWGYRIFRLDSTLDAIGINADGVLGIYNLESGLDALDIGTLPRSSEYIPQWTFILDNFNIFEIHILWDVGIGISTGSISASDGSLSIDPPSVGVKLLPSISIVADLNLMVDYWWNDQVTHSLGPIGIVIPVIPVCYLELGASLTINSVKDYVDQNPIHLWGSTGADPVIFDWTWSKDWAFYVVYFEASINVDLTIDVPGFHRMGDHPTPF